MQKTIKLTDRQRVVLDYIRRCVADRGYPPTIREIGSHLGIRSTNGVNDHVKALEKKGYLKIDTNRSRTIEVIGQDTDEDRVHEVPILGHVAAGLPLLAEENLDGKVKLPGDYIGTGPHFALHVRGDSMRDAGIMDGDLAVFRQQQVANNGDIVVAMVEEAVTLKRFYKEKNRVRLQAENPAYPPIFTQNVRVLGKLAHLIRSYE